MEKKLNEYHFVVNGLEIKANYHEEDVKEIFLPLLKRWTNLQKEKNKRIFVFLAAPPGCGKTTLSLFLEMLSKEERFSEVQAIGMDGFHYTNEYLSNHTFEEDSKILCLKKRKGNYATFDKESLKYKIIEGKEKDNLWPIYSRELHDPIKDQICLKNDIILLEGNYLLLNEHGWEDLIDYCDDSIFLYSDIEVLKKRLIERKVKGGLSLEEATKFYLDSDCKNIEKVLYHSHQANIMLEIKENRFYIKEKNR